MPILNIPVIYLENAILKGRRKGEMFYNVSMEPFEINNIETMERVGNIRTDYSDIPFTTQETPLLKEDEKVFCKPVSNSKKHTNDNLATLQKKLDKIFNIFKKNIAHSDQQTSVGEYMLGVNNILDISLYDIHKITQGHGSVKYLFGDIFNQQTSFEKFSNHTEKQIIGDNKQETKNRIQKHFDNNVRVFNDELILSTVGPLISTAGDNLKLFNEYGRTFQLLNYNITDPEKLRDIFIQPSIGRIFPAFILSPSGSMEINNKGKNSNMIIFIKHRIEFDPDAMRDIFPLERFIQNTIGINTYRPSEKVQKSITFNSSYELLSSMISLIEAQKNVFQDGSEDSIEMALQAMRNSVNSLYNESKKNMNPIASSIEDYLKTNESFMEKIREGFNYTNTRRLTQ